MYCSSKPRRTSPTFILVVGDTHTSLAPSSNSLMLFKNELSSIRPSSGRIPENVTKPVGRDSVPRPTERTNDTAAPPIRPGSLSSRNSFNLLYSRKRAALLTSRTTCCPLISADVPNAGSIGMNALPPGVRLKSGSKNASRSFTNCGFFAIAASYADFKRCTAGPCGI